MDTTDTMRLALEADDSIVRIALLDEQCVIDAISGGGFLTMLRAYATIPVLHIDVAEFHEVTL